MAKRKQDRRTEYLSTWLTKAEKAKLKAEHRDLWPSLSWSAFLRQRLGLTEMRVPVVDYAEFNTKWNAAIADELRRRHGVSGHQQ